MSQPGKAPRGRGRAVRMAQAGDDDNSTAITAPTSIVSSSSSGSSGPARVPSRGLRSASRSGSGERGGGHGRPIGLASRPIRGNRGRSNIHTPGRGPAPGAFSQRGTPSSGTSGSSGPGIAASSTSGSSASGNSGQRSNRTGDSNDSEEQLFEAKKKSKLSSKARKKPMSRMTASETELAKRPGYGTAGQAIEIGTNHWKVKAVNNKAITIYQYKFDSPQFTELEPDVNDAYRLFDEYQKKINEQRRQQKQEPIQMWYDGRNMAFSTTLLGGIGHQAETKIDSYPGLLKRGSFGRTEFMVYNTPVKQFPDVDVKQLIDFIANPESQMQRPSLELITCIDCLIKTQPSIALTRVGQSFYGSARAQQALGNGRVAIPGMSLAVHAHQNDVHILVKAKHGAFYKAQPLVEMLNEVFFGGGNRGGHGGYGGRGGGHQNRGGRGGSYGGRQDEAHSVTDRGWIDHSKSKRAKQATSGLLVNIKYPKGREGAVPKTRKIKSYSTQGASQLNFKLESGQITTVADYFKNQGHVLRFPDACCVNTKSAKQPEWYPIELLHIVAQQPVKGALGDREVSAMIKICAISAVDTLKACTDQFRQIQGDLKTAMNGAGLDVEDKCTRVNGRQLNEPSLRYKDDQVARPKDGVWNPAPFRHINKHLISFAGVCFARPNHDVYQQIERFVHQLKRTGQNVGLNVNPDVHYEDCPQHQDDRNIEACFNQIISEFQSQRKQLQMIMCFMPRKDAKLYGSIKFIAERKLGVLTQCITMKSCERANDQLLTMVLMKLNAKLGGVNCSVDLKMPDQHVFAEPTIVIGIAVNNAMSQGTHVSRPSTVGIAFSTDPKVARFNLVCARSHDGKSVNDMDVVMMKVLKAFHKHTKDKPKYIIVYRTGLPDAEKGAISKGECDSIMKACTTIEEGYRPKLTYITVDKNHSTRFACKDPGKQIGKSKNLPAGCIVDKTITGCNGRFDFYLQSSQGIQGTSIPSYYVVCRDDNRLTADNVQALSFHLCYGYTRCNRTVSMPNCVMYAKLAAERGRIWICKAIFDDMSGDTSSEDMSDAAMESQSQMCDKVLDISTLLSGQKNENLYGQFFYC